MLNFKEINNKSNINHKSYKPIFSKQGNKIIKKKEQINDSIDTRLVNKQNISSMNNDSKKQNSFKENFESNLDNPNDKLFYFPNMFDVNNNINDYTKRIQNAESTVNNANNLLNDKSMTNLKNTYSTELNTYKTLTNKFNNNTNSYFNNNNNNNKNVYVTSLSTNKDAIFKGLYNDNLNNPSMNIIQSSVPSFSYDDCKNTAFLTGKKYFGLIGTDKNTKLAKCAVSDTLTNTSKNGLFKNSCNVSNNDGYIYGGSWANAIYKINDGIVNPSDYIGCYKDKQDGNIFSRAMYPASWLVNWFSSILKVTGYNITDPNSITLTDPTKLPLINNAVYQPVFFAGNSNSAPWGITFIDNTAQWIWYTENANITAPQIINGTELIFGSYLGPNTQTNYIIGNIYCGCDNYCTIKVNGSDTDINGKKMIISGWNNNPVYQVKINPNPNPKNPVYNIIELFVKNLEAGPAGVILSILDNDNKVICRTTTDYYKSSDVGGSCTWLSSSKVSTVQVPLTNDFSVQSCAKYANTIGYPYIGLQYIQNNKGGTAQCFVSNDLNSATRFGSLDGSVNYNNKSYGLNTSNAVYELNTTANPSLLGSVGYIDDNNHLLKYPDSMITYGNTYTQLNGYSSNIDISFYGTLDDCKQKCNENNNCNGFTYSTSKKMGYFSKTNKVFGYRNLSEPLIKNTSDYTLYMRDPKINNNKSCSKTINNITADDWSSYLNNNSKDDISQMTPQTICGLYKSNEQIKQELDIANKKLNKDSQKLFNNTTNVINVNKNLNSQIFEDKNIITESSSLYDKIDNTYTSMIDNNNLNNILDNSNLVIKQSQYYYIIWIILILLIIIGVVIILRRI